jgi:CDP-diacylglycerol--glycerol-3-phosphate 3-phosphatidyltransferase
VEQVYEKDKKTFSNNLRVIFKGLLNLLGAILNHLGLKPNTVTLLGLIGNIITAVIIGLGHMTAGGFMVLFVGILDVADGALARLQGQTTKFGNFFDSVIDRYSDLLILGGLLYYYLEKQNTYACLLVFAAVIGTVLVSYVRAKAESLGYKAQIGILSRFERYVVLVPALVFNLPIIGLWILAVLGNLTAVQRIWHVWKQSKLSEEE